jgi:hypothetical protein
MMPELTLESLAKRVEALESALAVKETNRSPKDWRMGVGLFAGSEFMKQVDEEGRRIREADREAARQEGEDDET